MQFILPREAGQMMCECAAPPYKPTLTDRRSVLHVFACKQPNGTYNLGGEDSCYHQQREPSVIHASVCQPHLTLYCYSDLIIHYFCALQIFF